MLKRRVTALNFLVVVALAYAGTLGLLWLFQERIVFQPPADRTSEDTATRVEYTSRDGIGLVSYVIEPAVTGGPVVLAFHGNAMLSRWLIPWARELSRRTGAVVVLPEYRGYDGLSGVPNYTGAGLDAEAALTAMSERYHVPAADMIYYGHSLGSAIAAELAAKSPPHALLLESPLTSARDMAGRWPIPGLRLFWGAISRVHYVTDERVAQLDAPVHVAHGERDIIIPVRMGRDVHSAALRKGELLLVPEAGHNDVAIAGGDAYWRWLQGAIRPGQH